jgi:hypothetical protein
LSNHVYSRYTVHLTEGRLEEGVTSASSNIVSYVDKHKNRVTLFVFLSAIKFQGLYQTMAPFPKVCVRLVSNITAKCSVNINITNPNLIHNVNYSNGVHSKVW